MDDLQTIKIKEINETNIAGRRVFGVTCEIVYKDKQDEPTIEKLLLYQSSGTNGLGNMVYPINGFSDLNMEHFQKINQAIIKRFASTFNLKGKDSMEVSLRIGGPIMHSICQKVSECINQGDITNDTILDKYIDHSYASEIKKFLINPFQEPSSEVEIEGFDIRKSNDSFEEVSLENYEDIFKSIGWYESKDYEQVDELFTCWEPTSKLTKSIAEELLTSWSEEGKHWREKAEKLESELTDGKDKQLELFSTTIANATVNKRKHRHNKNKTEDTEVCSLCTAS